MSDMRERIAGWLKQEVRRAKADGIVVGMSGGVDSSVVAALSKEAVGDSMLALILPCYSQARDGEDAERVAAQLQIPVARVDLSPMYDAFLSILSGENMIARANLKPRLRMITLYYHANLQNYVVAGTGNKSELMVGYFTKYGDGGVDLLPLGGLLKTQVRELAHRLGIPEDIIKKSPSAGLWEGQTDEGEMGIPTKSWTLS